MKLLMENWRDFLNERMEFGEGFEQWLHGEGECEAQSVKPPCLMGHGFKKIGEGSFRAVWALPDNPNYVMKIADELWDEADTKGMNKQEADKIAQTGYPDLLPKVYDTADDYSWIVVERVEPYGHDNNQWIYDFFPIFAKFWKDNRDNHDFAWRNNSINRFFAGYTESRIDEIRGKDDENLVLTQELGGEDEREELESQLPPLYKRLLEFMEQYGIHPTEVRGDNVGRGPDGRFVILDSGWFS